MVDCVDYGSFFYPERQNEISANIISSLSREGTDSLKEVRMLITADPPEPISRSSKFYGLTYEELKRYAEFENFLKTYRSKNQRYNAAPLENDTAFRDILQDRQQSVLDSLNTAGVNIYGLNGQRIIACKMPLQENPSLYIGHTFFWIADGKKLIFLIIPPRINIAANRDGISQGDLIGISSMGFESQAPEIVDIFINIFKRYWPSEPKQVE